MVEVEAAKEPEVGIHVSLLAFLSEEFFWNTTLSF
jgi:hypothetical protein